MNNTDLRITNDFIELFRSIPRGRWATGDYSRGVDKHCALGHCGARESGSTRLSRRLVELFRKRLDTTPYEVNDGEDKRFKQLTPKGRILAALHEIKSHQEKES